MNMIPCPNCPGVIIQGSTQKHICHKEKFDTPDYCKKFDPVDRPAHYNQGKAQCKSCGHPIECIDITRHMDFAIGNAMKYLWRFREKNGLEDLNKARWYLEDAIKQLEKVEKV